MSKTLNILATLALLLQTASSQPATIPVRLLTEQQSLSDLKASLSLPVKMPADHVLELRKDFGSDDSIIVRTGVEWLRARAQGYGAMTTYDITMQSWFDHSAGTSAYLLLAQPSRVSYVADYAFSTNSLSELPSSLTPFWCEQIGRDAPPCPRWSDLFHNTSVTVKSPHQIELTQAQNTPAAGDIIIFEIVAWGDFNADGIEDLLMRDTHHFGLGSGRSYGHVLLSRLSKDAPLTEFSLPPLDLPTLIASLTSIPTQFSLDDHAVTVTGTLITDTFYGPPNYGKTPETDRVEKPYILKLDKPIEIVGDIAAATGVDGHGKLSTTTVSRIQLAGKFDVKQAKRVIGERVSLSGSFFPAHTGHHHTPMLLDCIHMERNTN